MLELKDVTINNQYKKQVKELHKSAFPADERMPFCILYSKAKKGKGELFAVTDGSSFIGLAHTVTFNKVTYLFFLAVKKNERGKGYGSAILDKIKERYANNIIILNIEELDEKYPDYENRVNRKRFYERNGFTLAGIKSTEAKVTYDMLVYGGNITYKEYADIIKYFAGSFIYRLLYKEIK